jgi:hypothetical protein
VRDMGILSANSSGQDDRLNNLLSCLERAAKARDERRRVGMQIGGRLSAPCHDIPFAGAANILGNPKSDCQLQPATPRPATASDADLERIRTVIQGLQVGRPVRRLPRAAQLSPISDLAAIDSQRTIPTRVSIDLNKLPKRTLQRPRRAFSGGTGFLVAGTIAAAWAGYFVVASRPPAVDFEAPSRALSETRLVPLSALPQADLRSTRLKGLTAGDKAAPEPQLTVISESKPPENWIEPRLPQTLSAMEYKATTGERNERPESSLVEQASPKSGADAAVRGLDIKPLIENLVSPAGVQVSACFPSASAVRQEYPEAWPSWTLRAAGHEGTKCWHATTRATAHDHRGEMAPKRPAVGTTENIGPFP